MSRWSVVVVDDAAEVRALVRAGLRLSRRYDVVAEGRTGLDAIELCSEHQPEIALLDISMPELDGLAALPRIHEVSPHTRVVMFTGFDEAGLAERARALGAAGFIQKSTAITELPNRLDALRAADSDALRPVEAPNAEELDNSVLHEHVERFREVFEEAAIGMATMTLTGRIVRVNKALSELVGRPAAGLVGTPYVSVAGEAASQPITNALRAAQEGAGRVVQFEFDVAEDSERRLLATAAPVRDARGRPLYLFLQCQDVTAQRRTEEELRQSEQRFRLLVEAVQDYAIFMLDPDGRIMSWNTGAQRIKGYLADEIIGQHFRVFYPDEMRAIRHPEHELELAKANGRYEEEGWRIRKDGSRFWASVVITALFDGAGTLVGFGKVTRDMSERRRMLLEAEEAARALAAANQELEAANARLAREAADQAQFLAVTAHELRSPIGVLAGSAKLLVEHVDELSDEERTDLNDSISVSAARLQRLLRDLLTAARLEAKAIQVDWHDVDVAKLLGRTVAEARAANPTAVIEFEADEGLYVRGEADRLAQVAENLISNALRHGAPPVYVRACAVDDRVELAVSDSGAGVSSQLANRIFERFASESGTGLGLFIVRELARAHGGDTDYGRDAVGRPCFTVVLPRSGASADARDRRMP